MSEPTLNLGPFNFPVQTISEAEKQKPEFYANCADWLIAQAQGIRDTALLEEKYQIIKGNFPDKYYKKILNPYNEKNEKYTRFPADMRNYDMMKGIIRRFVSEYSKNPHDFIVTAHNPEVVMARKAKVREEVNKLIEARIAQEINRTYNEYINQGGNPQEFNPAEQINIEEFAKKVEEEYIDEYSAQGQSLLDYIRDVVNDTLVYIEAYFNFVSFGETYTYSEIQGEKIIHRCVSPRDAFPIPNDNMFVEDYDAFCERRKLSYQQIIDEFGDKLEERDKNFLETYYAHYGAGSIPSLTFKDYSTIYSDCARKFSESEIQSFSSQPNMMRDLNPGLYDVWHVVWRGSGRRAIVKYRDEIGMISTRVENDDYKFSPELGDIAIEYVFVPQVYEVTRIGTRNTAVYPGKCKPVDYNRDGKLPYNGLTELLPGFGTFSVIDTVFPFQIFYNIVSYHREMVIARNKLSMMIIPKSLLGKNPDDTLYKMLAAGNLIYDDETDVGNTRAQQIRILQENLSDYITSLSNLLQEIKNSAREEVDMTPQRYGEIANSAGKGTTQEAIARGSMGSVIVELMMDEVRLRDYVRLLDYSKLAYIDGLESSYNDLNTKQQKFISLDIDKNVYADYGVTVKLSAAEKEKLEALRQFAFNLGQNGDANMAIAAIEGDNVAQVKKLVQKFSDLKNQHEEQLKQMDQMLEQMKQEFALKQIEAKGDEERKTAEVEGYFREQVALIQADSNRLSYPNDLADSLKREADERLAAANLQLQRDKVRLQREKLITDNENKDKDRALREKALNKKTTK